MPTYGQSRVLEEQLQNRDGGVWVGKDEAGGAWREPMDAGELSYPCHAAAACSRLGSRHEAYIAGDDERVYS